MANELATRIRELANNKIDFQDDVSEGIVRAHAVGLLELEDASDEFTQLIGDDADLAAIGGSAVDFADLLDDVDLTEGNAAKAEQIVRGLIGKNADPEVIEAGVKVFTKTLNHLTGVRAMNKYFDELRNEEPPVEDGE